MENRQKMKDWIMMGLEDIDDAKADFDEGRYHSSVFHAQQCCEKVLKGILSFFGIIHEKTHFPSDVLSGDILNNPSVTSKFNLTVDHIKLLLNIVENASCIEEQRSMPRYGWETKDRIIKPSEIYNKEKASEMLNVAIDILRGTYRFIELLGLDGTDDLLAEIKKYV